MEKRCIGGAIFLRHGQSEYTEVFPDLTEQGQQTIRDSSKRIKDVVDQYDYCEIVSSSSARALGSAVIIADALDCNGGITIEPAIAAAVIRDVERAKAFFDKYGQGGTEELSLAYNCQPCFEDGSIIEPRSKVRKRFYKYLAVLVRRLSNCLPNFCVVHTSHYEVLYHFAEVVFKLNYTADRPLAHGEPIMLSFYGSGSDEITEIEAIFRKKTARALFNCREETIVT